VWSSHPLSDHRSRRQRAGTPAAGGFVGHGRFTLTTPVSPNPADTATGLPRTVPRRVGPGTQAAAGTARPARHRRHRHDRPLVDRIPARHVTAVRYPCVVHTRSWSFYGFAPGAPGWVA